ncbi:unnamed protein product [Acanthosepion pharaonis]|uniref:Uncharacterized protein n=1 Tax=Acanthosepion pharaonis TaxID=158019 RepID=A0A812DKC7_ACAPH|nr:unnamed protein product [Sepia pharaonis]
MLPLWDWNCFSGAKIYHYLITSDGGHNEVCVLLFYLLSRYFTFSLLLPVNHFLSLSLLLTPFLFAPLFHFPQFSVLLFVIILPHFFASSHFSFPFLLPFSVLLFVIILPHFFASSHFSFPFLFPVNHFLSLSLLLTPFLFAPLFHLPQFSVLLFVIILPHPSSHHPISHFLFLLPVNHFLFFSLLLTPFLFAPLFTYLSFLSFYLSSFSPFFASSHSHFLSFFLLIISFFFSPPNAIPFCSSFSLSSVYCPSICHHSPPPFFASSHFSFPFLLPVNHFLSLSLLLTPFLFVPLFHFPQFTVLLFVIILPLLRIIPFLISFPSSFLFVPLFHFPQFSVLLFVIILPHPSSHHPISHFLSFFLITICFHRTFDAHFLLKIFPVSFHFLPYFLLSSFILFFRFFTPFYCFFFSFFLFLLPFFFTSFSISFSFLFYNSFISFTFLSLLLTSFSLIFLLNINILHSIDFDVVLHNILSVALSLYKLTVGSFLFLSYICCFLLSTPNHFTCPFPMFPFTLSLRNYFFLLMPYSCSFISQLILIFPPSLL